MAIESNKGSVGQHLGRMARDAKLASLMTEGHLIEKGEVRGCDGKAHQAPGFLRYLPVPCPDDSHEPTLLRGVVTEFFLHNDGRPMMFFRGVCPRCEDIREVIYDPPSEDEQNAQREQEQTELALELVKAWNPPKVEKAETRERAAGVA